MSPAQLICAVAVFALLQMLTGVHRMTAHAPGYPTIESTAPRLDLEPFLEWLANGLQDEQAARALEEPEAAGALDGH
jgi:hypothetical protein